MHTNAMKNMIRLSRVLSGPIAKAVKLSMKGRTAVDSTVLREQLKKAGLRLKATKQNVLTSVTVIDPKIEAANKAVLEKAEKEEREVPQDELAPAAVAFGMSIDLKDAVLQAVYGRLKEEAVEQGIDVV